MFRCCFPLYRSSITIMIMALAVTQIVGCGGLPKTYPVKGRVIFKGGKPVTDGKITFQSTTDPQIQAVGDIEQDGTFTLTTYKEGKKASGAVEGQHKVIVELERPSEVIALPTPYTIDRSENNLTIELPKARR